MATRSTILVCLFYLMYTVYASGIIRNNTIYKRTSASDPNNIDIQITFAGASRQVEGFEEAVQGAIFAWEQLIIADQRIAITVQFGQIPTLLNLAQTTVTRVFGLETAAVTLELEERFFPGGDYPREPEYMIPSVFEPPTQMGPAKTVAKMLFPEDANRFDSQEGITDGVITLSDSANFDWDITTPVERGAVDGLGVLVREFGHVFGFISDTTRLETPVGTTVYPTVLDIYRFPVISDPSWLGSQRMLIPGMPAMYYTNQETDPKGIEFSTGLLGSDRNPADSWKEGRNLGMMDPIIDPNEVPGFSLNDINAFYRLGWTLPLNQVPCPTIFWVFPIQARPGDRVTIRGFFFYEDVSCILGGVASTIQGENVVVNNAASEVSCTVPSTVTIELTGIEIASGGILSNQIPFRVGEPTTAPTDASPTRPPTAAPTRAPTLSPTTRPPTTRSPTTNPPSRAPTRSPTVAPTTRPPTRSPTTRPPTTTSPTTNAPTRVPSRAPTRQPTTLPPTTSAPITNPPSRAPTIAPTMQPTTISPSTRAPTTRAPTSPPVPQPTTQAPTRQPTTIPPSTRAPTTRAPPSPPVPQPTTQAPTLAPSTQAPVVSPTTEPPTILPTLPPTTSQPTTFSPTPSTGAAPSTVSSPSTDSTPSTEFTPSTIQNPSTLRAPNTIVSPSTVITPSTIVSPASTNPPPISQGVPATAQNPSTITTPSTVASPSTISAPSTISTPSAVFTPTTIQNPTTVRAPNTIATPTTVMTPSSVRVPGSLAIPSSILIPTPLLTPFGSPTASTPPPTMRPTFAPNIQPPNTLLTPTTLTQPATVSAPTMTTSVSAPSTAAAPSVTSVAPAMMQPPTTNTPSTGTDSPVTTEPPTTEAPTEPPTTAPATTEPPTTSSQPTMSSTIVPTSSAPARQQICQGNLDEAGNCQCNGFNCRCGSGVGNCSCSSDSIHCTAEVSEQSEAFGGNAVLFTGVWADHGIVLCGSTETCICGPTSFKNENGACYRQQASNFYCKAPRQEQCR